MKSDRDWLVGRSGLFAEPGDRVIAVSLYFLWKAAGGRSGDVFGTRVDIWTVTDIVYPEREGTPLLVLGGRMTPVLSTSYTIVKAVDSSLLTSS